MFYLMDPSQISAILSHLESFLPALFFLIFSRSFQAELRGEETNHRVSSLLCTAFFVTSLAKNEKWGLILLYLRDIKKNTLGVRLLAYHRNEQSTSPLLDSSHQNGCRYLLIETSQENFTPQLRDRCITSIFHNFDYSAARARLSPPDSTFPIPNGISQFHDDLNGTKQIYSSYNLIHHLSVLH